MMSWLFKKKENIVHTTEIHDQKTVNTLMELKKEIRAKEGLRAGIKKSIELKREEIENNTKYKTSIDRKLDELNQDLKRLTDKQQDIESEIQMLHSKLSVYVGNSDLKINEKTNSVEISSDKDEILSHLLNQMKSLQEKVEIQNKMISDLQDYKKSHNILVKVKTGKELEQQDREHLNSISSIDVKENKEEVKKELGEAEKNAEKIESVVQMKKNSVNLEEKLPAFEGVPMPKVETSIEKNGLFKGLSGIISKKSP